MRGGNRRSKRIDAHRDLIIGWVDVETDLSLAEIAERLEPVMGYRPQPSCVCRFFLRHKITRKKRRRTLPNKTART